nr:retrovirus-related Pol polyprotein from transposon TNT 1-94 [Tanacetum cinerariifolium]
SFKKIYKPSNNNLRTSSNTSRANQDNSPRINRSNGYENQRICNVAGARETVGSTVIQKHGIQCYNCKEFEHVARECQKPKRAKDAAYHREKMLLCKQEEAVIQLNAEQADWRDDTDDDELEDQELKAHYMYMAQLQEVSPDAADSGPIFDDEPLQKVSNDDHYNVFAIESTHLEQSISVLDTYPIEQDAQNMIIDSLDMSNDRVEIDQNDDDNDLVKERELLASLIEKLKCEIDESKNRNKFLETSNKVLVEKLKGEIEDFKNKNKSLESSINYFKEANNRLSETNNLLYTDYKKSEAELVRRNSREYASQMEIECTKCLNEEMVADLRYFNSLELEVDSLRSQLEAQKTQFLNEIDRLSREYYYADHMNVIFGVYTELDEVTNLQCGYLELLEKCECLENELSKSKMISKSFEAVQKHAINLELELQQCKEKITNDKLFKHDMCVLNSVAKPLKKTVASASIQKPRNITRKIYERFRKACSWWYPKFTPSGYKWKPKSGQENVNLNLVEIVLFIVDSGCSKHMIGNLKLLINFVEKFLGTVKFGNDQIAPILGYRDLVQRAVTIKRVYYVEGLNHNLFSVGQFCDANLEVAFRKSTCYICDLKGNDLLTGSRGKDLYSIKLQDTNCPNPICLMAKASSSQALLWHRHLSHLNFDTINLLSKNDIMVGLPKLKFFKDHICSFCELGKAKRKSFHTKITSSLKRRLQLLHIDLCGPMRVASINGKRYVLVIVDDYSRYTWTHFLRSKNETPEVLINFLRLVQRGLQAQVRIVRTDKGTEFLNQTLHAYFAAEGILHQTSIARTPEQNSVVERRNRTLVEAARTMLSAAKIPLFF